ncbi:MAG: class II fructose-bisphosphate aldolase, partial [Bdellovibrionales bacterium]|nr:class II fructose-bisphosphate aldolase [Bdellovibrionales bacterium]
MPVPNTEQYLEMLDNAKVNKFAFPAINVSNIVTANAAIAAFAESKSDGIVQLSIGAAKFASGTHIANPVMGAASIADHVHRMAKDLDVFIALHTDHCQAEELAWVNGLIDLSKERRKSGQAVLFNGHMFDGSALALDKNMEVARPLLEKCKDVGIVLEVEAGIVGGEEDGAATTDSTEKLYTSPEDMLYVADQLFPIKGRFMFAATFGNVHGIYKPGNVKLTPSILKDGQAAVAEKFGGSNCFDLVFHGGSGSPVEQIHETLEYGVVKMNVDTATQFAFSQPIAKHMKE